MEWNQLLKNLETENSIELNSAFGKPERGEDLADFILKPIDAREKIDEGVNSAAKAVCEFVENGIDSAMNKFN